MEITDNVLAIPDVCAWPNLTQLADGRVLAALYNQPSHGLVAGDVDGYVSADGGLAWTHRGVIAARDFEDSNRMNFAVGIREDGVLIAVSSGYYDVGDYDTFAPTRVYLSQDDGATWDDVKPFPLTDWNTPFIPYGNILAGPGDALHMCTYGSGWAQFFRSNDGGITWELQSWIDRGINETAPLYLGEGHWIAVARTSPDTGLRLYRSTDNGLSWTAEEGLTETRQVPGNLLLLDDGVILLTHGDRRPEHLGVWGRISRDNGLTWEPPFRLASMLHPDGGYPSSVVLEGCTILTAYYAKQSDLYDGYQMSVVRWRFVEGEAAALTPPMLDSGA